LRVRRGVKWQKKQWFLNSKELRSFLPADITDVRFADVLTLISANTAFAAFVSASSPMTVKYPALKRLHGNEKLRKISSVKPLKLYISESAALICV